MSHSPVIELTCLFQQKDGGYVAVASFLRMETLDWIHPTHHSVLHIIAAVRKR
jgi:hypothetical protein